MATKKKKSSSKTASVKVAVAKMKVPFSPGVAAVSKGATHVALGEGGRVEDGNAPVLVVFDIAKKRAALALKDAGTVVLERGKTAAYVGAIHWLADGRIAYTRRTVKLDNVELVVRDATGEGKPVVKPLGDLGGLQGATDTHLFVTTSGKGSKRYDIASALLEIPEEGAAFDEPTCFVKRAGAAVTDGALWTPGTKAAWKGASLEGKAKARTLSWAVDRSFSKSRIVGDVRGHHLVHGADYHLHAVDVTTGETFDMKGSTADVTYKNHFAVSDGRVLVANSTGELMLIDIATGKRLWKTKAGSSRSSPDSVAFSIDGGAAVAAMAYEPFRIAVMRFG